MTNPKASGGTGTSDDLEALVGQNPGNSQGILSSVELHSEDNTRRTFSIGTTYPESAVLMYMISEADLGATALFRPSLNGNNVNRLYFNKVKERGVLGSFFAQTKYVLKRIEEKTADPNTTRKEDIAVIYDENGGVCREFLPGALYNMATLDQYLVSVDMPSAQSVPERIAAKFNSLKVFESKAFNGNGHYYLFVQPKPGRESYVFVSAIKKEAFNDYEKETDTRPLERTVASG